MLEELGFPYEVRRYRRDKKTMLAPPELRNIHPLGKSPVLEDDDDQHARRILSETGAIVEYLVEKAGGRLGSPEARGDQLRYRHFLHYAEGSLMPVLFAQLVLSRVPLLGGVARRRFQPMVDVQLAFVESELASLPWFAGETFTAADVMMSFPLEAARDRAGITRDTYPRIFEWLDLVHARPSYQAALARGGPYAYA